MEAAARKLARPHAAETAVDLIEAVSGGGTPRAEKREQ